MFQGILYENETKTKENCKTSEILLRQFQELKYTTRESDIF